MVQKLLGVGNKNDLSQSTFLNYRWQYMLHLCITPEMNETAYFLSLKMMYCKLIKMFGT